MMGTATCCCSGTASRCMRGDAEQLAALHVVAAFERCCQGLCRKRGGCCPCRYNSAGYENADLCAWTFSSALFRAGGGLANVRWDCPAAAASSGCTSPYYLIQVRSSL